MNTETAFVININASAMLIGIFVFFMALFAIIWKGRGEISEVIKEGLKPLGATLDKIKNNLKIVSDVLINSDLPFDHEKLETYSPLRVTDADKKYLEDVSFKKVFLDNENDFYQYIDREDPTNDYDIENAAIRSVIQLFHKPFFAPVKDYFYNHPKEDEKSFMRVAGVFVRDKYMEYKKKAAISSQIMSLKRAA